MPARVCAVGEGSLFFPPFYSPLAGNSRELLGGGALVPDGHLRCAAAESVAIPIPVLGHAWWPGAERVPGLVRCGSEFLLATPLWPGSPSGEILREGATSLTAISCAAAESAAIAVPVRGPVWWDRMDRPGRMGSSVRAVVERSLSGHPL